MLFFDQDNDKLNVIESRITLYVEIILILTFTCIFGLELGQQVFWGNEKVMDLYPLRMF